MPGKQLVNGRLREVFGLDALQRKARDNRLQAAGVSAFAHMPVAVYGQVAQLGRRAVVAKQQLLAQHDGVAKAGAKVNGRHTAAVRQAKVFQIEQKQVVHIAVDIHGQAQLAAKLLHHGVIIRDALDVRRLQHHRARTVDGGGKADGNCRGHLALQMARAVGANLLCQLLCGLRPVCKHGLRAELFVRAQVKRPVHKGKAHIGAPDVDAEHRVL